MMRNLLLIATLLWSGAVCAQVPLNIPGSRDQPDTTYKPGVAPTIPNLNLPSGPAKLGPDGGLAYTSLNLPVTQRAPKPTDDWSAGYYAAGTVAQVPITAQGTTPYTTISAAFNTSTGSCASYGILQPALYAGKLWGLKQITPTEGCVTAPAVIITGDGAGAAAASTIAPVGAGWIGPDGATWQELRDTPGQAAWARLFIPPAARAADLIPGAIFGYGEDLLRAGFSGSAANIIRPDLGTNADIGFVGTRLNYGALDAFSGGSTLTQLAKLYDQVGSNPANGPAGIGTLTACTITAGGTVTGTPTMTLSGGGFTTAPTVTLVNSGGTVTGCTISNAGAGGTSVPTAVVAGVTGLRYSLTVGQGPSVAPINLVGNGGRFVWDQTVETNGITANRVSGTSSPTLKFSQPLTVGSGLTATSNNLTVVMLISVGQSTRNSAFFEASGATPFSIAQSSQAGVNALIAKAGSAKSLTRYHLPITPTVVAVSSTNAGLTIYAGDGQDATTYSAVSGVSLAGAVLGCGTAVSDSSGDVDCGNVVIRDAVGFTGAVTAAQIQMVSLALMRDAGQYPQIRAAMVTTGDSIADGAFGNYFQSWPRMMMSQLLKPVVGYNMAISGQRTPGELTGNPGMPYWFHTCQRAPGPNYASVAIDTNDILDGTDPGVIWNNNVTEIGVLTAAGCTVRIATTLPRGAFSATQEANRQALIYMMRTNYAAAGAVGLLDFAQEPSMGNSANLTNTAFYQDQTHPGYVYLGGGLSQGGYPYLAALVAQQYNQLSVLRGN